ncbi:MAG TPA: hypothetical protein VJB90_05430 [Candidatus Nanoarchaeia archaeon]|nr:hypothetical protein [Candidatus Nanoarchaeia archaeon]
MKEMKVLWFLRNLDTLSKLAVVINFAVITYIILLFSLRPLIIPEDSPLGHTTVMGDHIMTFSTVEQSTLNVLAIGGAVIVASSMLFFLRSDRNDTKSSELSIIKNVLTKDEKRLINTVEEAGEITQDSLRFRLEWSKAKVSAIVTGLERVNILQRKREGKTYSVFLSKSKSPNQQL